MTGRLILAPLLAAFVLFFGPLPANAEEQALSAAEKKQIETLIHDYLMAHPEVVLESVRKYREEQAKAAQAEALENMEKLKAQLLSDPHTPVGGNPEGDVTVVEFFDYRCGYCKRAYPALKDAVEEDGNVRIVFKEFPILGEASVYASRAALATWIGDKSSYEAFHDALMTHGGELTSEAVWALAKKAGVDVEKAKAQMDSPMIAQMIEANMKLAQALDINGTPAFVIGDELVPGFIDQQRLEVLIAKARKG